MTSDSEDASIVSAVINMGRSLNMGVVAEGVQTREQLAFLQPHHCPEGQGFYFARPVLAPQFASLLSLGGAKLAFVDSHLLDAKAKRR